MKIIPVLNSIFLPDTKLLFGSKEAFELNMTDLSIGSQILFVFKKSSDVVSDIEIENYYPIAISARVSDIDDSGNYTVFTMKRYDVTDIDLDMDYFEGTVREFTNDVPEDVSKIEFDAVVADLENYMSNFKMGAWVSKFLGTLSSWEELITRTAPYMNLNEDDRNAILAADTKRDRIDHITRCVQQFIMIMEATQEANEEREEKYKKIYREDALKKQIKFLQDQLDEMHPENKSDAALFEEKIANAGMNEEAKKEAEKILNRMKSQGQEGHEYSTLYDYLDFVTTLDWKKHKTRKIDLDKAKDVLDDEHFGLDKVKRRIIEQLAVMDLSKKQSGSIILFVGPPGTGKTSIAHSIANALKRKYVRISLGGVRDEAEIRGHRRTYIGAMPGRIMDGINKSGVSNPVVVLDEIDKLSTSYNGDPASALLEVLDPEQNSTFTDHYMNVPYDLSDVMFICTANSIDTIPGPLLDRMEVIQFNGYTPLEKLHIGRDHLLDKSLDKSGVKKENINISDEAISKVISDYTMEAGVRGLGKRLDLLCRRAAVEIVKNKGEAIDVTDENVSEYIDSKPIFHDSVKETKDPGIVTGLAWTAVGGEILFIEAMLTKGKGETLITGQLGDVMKESVMIAKSLVKKLYPEEASKKFEENDLHIHVPAGATPKDGPSAGITLTTALASSVLGKPISPDYGMTGEVSLRGNVMPIGGLPEKLMAAQRAGVKKVFIPKENEYDLKDVAAEVKEQLEIIPVEKVVDVLEKVLA